MTDLEWKRPMPTGVWVTVNNPGPGDVLIQRWDPNAKPLGLGCMFVVNRNRRQAFVYNLKARLRRISERITRRG